MAELIDIDPLAANNQLAAPNGFPENMPYSDVNNSARELMAILARNYRDESGSISATGTNDLQIGANGNYPSYFQGLRIGFRAANTNTGAMTIQLNALGAVAFVNTAGAPMQAGSIIAGLIHFAVYNGSAFQLITNGFTFPGGNPGLFSAASPSVIPEPTDRVAITDTSDGDAPKFATVAEITNAVQLFNTNNPTVAPAVGDFLHFRDASDSNNPKTNTIQTVLDLGFTPAKLGDGTYDLLGLNGEAATTTIRFNAKTQEARFLGVPVADGGNGNITVTLDKEATNDSAAVRYQVAGVTRGLTGLITNNNYAIRISTDGSAFSTAVEVDTTTGVATVPSGLRSGSVSFTADDTVQTISPPKSSGLLVIMANEATSSAGVFFYDTGSTPALDTVFVGGRINNQGAAILTGTTGPDTDINVATQASTIYVENRRFSTATEVFYTFLS